MSTRQRAAGTLACALAAALLAGCTGTSAAVPDPRNGVPSAEPTTAAPSPSTAAPTATLPLTGQAAPAGADVTRPVVAVAVDAGSGLPAVAGVEAADVVWVSFPTPRRQRALALFQSGDATRVGPVADTRPLDGKLLRAISAVLEHSGGTSGFVKQVDRADLPQWSSLVQPSSFTVDPSGQIYGSTVAARQATGATAARPGLLPFADPAATPPAGTTTTATVGVPGQDAVRLTYDTASGTWRGAVGALPLVATNVVVQRVTYNTLVLPKTGGATEGNPDPDGQGATTVLSGPIASNGTWNRPGGLTNTKYVGPEGGAVRFLPGRTWVLLVPTGTPVQAS